MKRTKRDLVKAFISLFDEVDPSETAEEIDAFLHDVGHDPNKLGKRIRIAAEQASARIERRNSNDQD